MAISSYDGYINQRQMEVIERGSVTFPIGCYVDDLAKAGVPWHWHDELEYAIVTQDEPLFCMENARFHLRPGDCIFVNSGALHAMENVPGQRGEMHSAVFHPRLVGSMDSLFWQQLVQPLLKDAALQYLILRSEVEWQAQVIDCLDRVWHAMRDEPEDYENLVRYLLSGALRLINRNCEIDAKLPSEQERLDAGRIRAMLTYVEENFADELTVDAIARSASISNSVCLRCFHQVLGMTPIQYVKQFRLEKAAQQLNGSKCSVKEIALACGFNDVSYFTKSFREKMGVTPKEYRRLNVQEEM